jgi:hypothetical protein
VVAVASWSFSRHYLPTPTKARKRREREAVNLLWDQMEQAMEECNGDEGVLDITDDRRNTKFILRVCDRW